MNGWANLLAAVAMPRLDGEFSAGDLLMVAVLLKLKRSGILDEYSLAASPPHRIDRQAKCRFGEGFRR
ncbi:hypothetical protein [Nitrosospira briensis]|uniref:hypothetical protein n=1 Tax=Nitrosospira briensis TaxID=35799 RepID=UPI000942E6F9|nr:hypothetical protein [Nitrosospira briensis]